MPLQVTPFGTSLPSSSRSFGIDEHADPLDAGGRVGEPREDEMDDVLGQIVLAGGDEDLVAGELERTVRLRHRFHAHEAEVGAGLRFGQAHRPRPGAVDELGQEACLELVGGVLQERRVGALGERRHHREGEVRGAEDLGQHVRDVVGQALAAELRLGDERRPAPSR
jgi:hypothetical protein